MLCWKPRNPPCDVSLLSNMERTSVNKKSSTFLARRMKVLSLNAQHGEVDLLYVHQTKTEWMQSSKLETRFIQTNWHGVRLTEKIVKLHYRLFDR